MAVGGSNNSHPYFEKLRRGNEPMGCIPIEFFRRSRPPQVGKTFFSAFGVKRPVLSGVKLPLFFVSRWSMLRVFERSVVLARLAAADAGVGHSGSERSNAQRRVETK
jgi:hypothetical protein